MTSEALLAVLAQDGVDVPAWLREACERPTHVAILRAFGAATRRLGPNAHREMRPITAGAWPADGLARAALLLAVCERGEDPVGLVCSLYRAGSGREKQQLLTSLPLLPDGVRFVDVAREACRETSLEVFSAIACDNPFPAQHFDAVGWNQMVMKAIFNELPCARIFGLAARQNPELARMARDYVAERQAAGRSVPRDAAAIAEGASP